MDPVVRRGVEDLLQPPDPLDRLGVDPELVDEVDGRAPSRSAPAAPRRGRAGRRGPPSSRPRRPAGAARSRGCSARCGGGRRGWPTASGSRGSTGGSSSRWRPSPARDGVGGPGPVPRSAVRAEQPVAAPSAPPRSSGHRGRSRRRRRGEGAVRTPQRGRVGRPVLGGSAGPSRLRPARPHLAHRGRQGPRPGSDPPRPGGVRRRRRSSPAAAAPSASTFRPCRPTPGVTGSSSRRRRRARPGCRCPCAGWPRCRRAGSRRRGRAGRGGVRALPGALRDHRADVRGDRGDGEVDPGHGSAFHWVQLGGGRRGYPPVGRLASRM